MRRRILRESRTPPVPPGHQPIENANSVHPGTATSMRSSSIGFATRRPGAKPSPNAGTMRPMSQGAALRVAPPGDTVVHDPDLHAVVNRLYACWPALGRQRTERYNAPRCLTLPDCDHNEAPRQRRSNGKHEGDRRCWSGVSRLTGQDRRNQRGVDPQMGRSCGPVPDSRSRRSVRRTAGSGRRGSGGRTRL